MKFLLLALALYATESSAQIFRLNYVPTSNPTVNSFIEAELKKIENDINKDLPSGQPKRLMEGMANSSVMAGKGIGSDYASNMDVFLIGAGVGVGADLEKDKTTDSDISGVGVAPGVVLGLDLGFMDTKHILGLDTDKLNVYFNFMSLGHEQKSGETGKETNAEIQATSLGVHFRYDWIEGAGSKLFGWGGVKVHFGYEYNKTELSFSNQLNETIQASSGGATINDTITGNPKASILVNSHSIPLEISTNIQFLYLLSLYGGLGVDYNSGEAKGAGALNAPADTVTCTGGVCDPDGGGPATSTDITVTPEANIDAKGKANPFTYRGFAGVQFNLPFLRIFVQADKAFGNDLVGATAGVRIVY